MFIQRANELPVPEARTRTRTPSLTKDFESGASPNSTTAVEWLARAFMQRIIPAIRITNLRIARDDRREETRAKRKDTCLVGGLYRRSAGLDRKRSGRHEQLGVRQRCRGYAETGRSGLACWVADGHHAAAGVLGRDRALAETSDVTSGPSSNRLALGKGLVIHKASLQRGTWLHLRQACQVRGIQRPGLRLIAPNLRKAWARPFKWQRAFKRL